MKIKIYFFLFFAFILSFSVNAQNSHRWELSNDAGILWTVEKDTAHYDHIEMSGLQISAILRYGIDKSRELSMKKELVFPMLRTIPNDTHASLVTSFDKGNELSIQVNGAKIKEYPESFNIKGKLTVISKTNTSLSITRTLFPSTDKAALIEFISLKNNSIKNLSVKVDNNYQKVETDPTKGVYGAYIIEANTYFNAVENDSATRNLKPGEIFRFSVVYSGRKACEQPSFIAAAFELKKRDFFIQGLFDNLVLDTPNDTINREFAFAKIRATESIYDTKAGLMHGPGGGSYYAAIWANDQAEYVDPFFPFEGNLNGNESAINSFRLFASYMNPEFKPIPSSIIAEGSGYWNGAGDRGDMAMIAYGASRFALAYGEKETAKELWPLITWCMEYLERKKTAKGVFQSDSDELEGRFPSGTINLSTNSLAYGAYVSASYLAESLGLKSVSISYMKKSQVLKADIESYFGANVQGFDTYKYYDGNTKLRSWICMPLVMGIDARKAETIRALFSDYLWTSSGILTESGSKTFWDRATLYAFRGLFAAGATDKSMKYFKYYSSMRLLGEHVPYPVEAWPEGDQRHLSAESALYCRVVTEGLFGINPTGLRKFTFSPKLPSGWDYMNLRNIKAFGQTFDIIVKREASGQSIKIVIKNRKILVKHWSSNTPMTVNFDDLTLI